MSTEIIEVPAPVNIPVKDDIDALRAEVAEVKAILEPLVPFLAALPELMSQVGPILDGLKKSPVLRMMGVSL